MKDPRYTIVAEQLEAIHATIDSETISQALSRIAFAALPDWGQFEVPPWLVDGLRPLLASILDLSDSLKVDLLECLAHLYETPAGPRLDFELGELKANLAGLPTGALPFALAIIAHDGHDAKRYLEEYANHEHSDIRTEARAGLERLILQVGHTP